MVRVKRRTEGKAGGWNESELSWFSFSHAAKPACNGDSSPSSPTGYQPTHRQG